LGYNYNETFEYLNIYPNFVIFQVGRLNHQDHRQTPPLLELQIIRQLLAEAEQPNQY